MKKLFVIIGCSLLLSLAACSSGSDQQQTTTTKVENVQNVQKTQKKTVFDGYVQDVNKAKQVQKTIGEAQKKLKAKIQQVETGSSD